MRSVWMVAGVAVLLATATTAMAAETISFRRDIVPLFAKECAFCHMKEGPVARLILEPRFAYAMIVNVPSGSSALKRVEPGDPQRSYLLLKMQDRHRAAGGSGDRMPPGWMVVTPEEIALVRAWIAAGAADN